MKKYINANDYQGTNWALGRILTIKGWREQAMDWAYMDDNFGTYNALKYYKIKNNKLLDFINEFWDIHIVELTPELEMEWKDYE